MSIKKPQLNQHVTKNESFVNWKRNHQEVAMLIQGTSPHIKNSEVLFSMGTLIFLQVTGK